jgi:tricorn protease
VKRVTRTAGEERSPVFSPDGRRLAYAAERDGHWILVEAALTEKDETTFAEATRIEEKPIRLAAEDAMLPVYSPDGTRLAYVANRESVRVVTPADGRDVEVLPKGLNYSYADGTWWLSWSPDGKWIAAPVQVRYGTTNVAVVTAEGGAPPVRVSPSGEFQALAQWSADGAVLYWANIAGSGAELDGVFTSRAARDEFGRKLRSEALPEAQSPAPPANGDARANSGKSWPVRPFEPDGIDTRGLRLTTQPSGLIAFGLMDDGVSVLTIEMSQSAQSDGSVLSGEVRDLRLQSRKTLFSGLPFVSLLHGKRHAAAAMSRDHKKLYLTAPDGLIEVDIQKGTSRVIRIAADVAQDQSELRRAAFEQFWMLTKKKFFDPGMNGVDWDAAHARYARFLPHLADPRDLAEILSQMAGELNASHTAGRYRTVLPAQDTVASLGLIYDERYPGPGMKVAEVLPGGPFDAATSSARSTASRCRTTAVWPACCAAAPATSSPSPSRGGSGSPSGGSRSRWSRRPSSRPGAG